MRKISWVAALVLLTAGFAVADTSADKKKGKPGEGCKANSDCDQSGRPQRCRDSKCEFAPTHPVTFAPRAIGDTSVDKKKGKPGSGCKSSADCDQSQQPQACKQNKCQVDYPPPPT